MNIKNLIFVFVLAVVIGTIVLGKFPQIGNNILKNNQFILCDEEPIRISLCMQENIHDVNILSRIGLTLVEHEEFAAEYVKPRLEFGGLYVSEQSYLIIQLKNNDPLSITIQDNETLSSMLGVSRSEIRTSASQPLLAIKYEEVRFSYRELNEIVNLLLDTQLQYKMLTFLASCVFNNNVSVGVDIGADIDVALDNIIEYLLITCGTHDEDYYRDIIVVKEMPYAQLF